MGKPVSQAGTEVSPPDGRASDPRPPVPGRVRRLPVAQGYRLWAPSYDLDPNPLLALEERTLPSLLPNLAGKFILDAACGTGRWLRRLLRLGARGGAGVDLSRPMLAVAASKPDLCGKLVQGDCLALPVRASAADVIVCSFALNHISNVCALARELARASRAQGHAFVSDVHPQGFQRGWRTGFRSAGGPIEIAAEAHSPAEVSSAFRGQGFELRRTVEAWLDERDRPIFVRSGRLDLFEAACAHPAVVIFHFVRDPRTQSG